MHSNTKIQNCLIIEDDKFKLDNIRSLLRETIGEELKIDECRALSTAASLLSKERYDFVIIDMSIHSHEPEAGAGSPVPLPSGGLDVLFEINYLNHRSLCIVLTQYTDIQIEGIPIPIDLAAAEIREKFDINVCACIQYSENSQDWTQQIIGIIKKNEGTIA